VATRPSRRSTPRGTRLRFLRTVFATCGRYSSRLLYRGFLPGAVSFPRYALALNGIH
jgi:hypothetical protein